MTTYRGIISICNKLGIAARYGTRAEADSFFEMMGGTPCVFIHYNPNVKARLGWEAYTLIFGGDDVARTTEAVVSRMFDLYNVFWYTRLTRQNGNVVGVVALRYRMRIYGQGGGGQQEPDALNFTMPNGGTITLTRSGSPTIVTLEYTLDGGQTWTEWTESGTTRTLTLNAGEKVYIRNTSTSSTGFSTSISDQYRFSFSDTAHAYGNTNSLLCKDPNNAIISGYCFLSLFNGASTLKSAAEIPSLVTADRCYQDMYKGTGISAAPVLPATYVDIYAYYRIFADCHDLAYVKTYMTSLYSLSSINYWLRDVAATGDFYCDPSLNIPLNSGSGIPSGWTRHDI